MSKHTKEQAAETRVEMYADFIADDVDGLVHNVAPAFGPRFAIPRRVLTAARERVAAALVTLDTAIAAQEPA